MVMGHIGLKRNADLHEVAYRQAVAELRLTPTAAARSALIRALAASLDVSLQTVYANLKKWGWESGRKERADKGSSCVPDAELEQVAELVARARNKRGTPNLPQSEAHRIAQEQGLEAGTVSPSHLNRLMRQKGLDTRRMCAATPAIARIAQHPNHVWFFDISVAVQWYLRDEAGRRVIDQYMDAGARFYPGKAQNERPLKIQRFAITDRLTGAYYVRYYYSAGEKAEDVADFLYRAMAPKSFGDAWPFRGIPRRLVLDQGSANKSGLIQTLLEELGIEAEYHAPGNARASGAVETRHRHWQASFEARLANLPRDHAALRDLTALNEAAEKACATFNATREHSRHGSTPMAAWSLITSEQLRECPDREVFFALAAQRPKTGTLDKRCWLQVDGRKWLISGPDVYEGQKVRYRLSPFLATGMRAWDDQGRELSCEELRFDAFGEPLNGNRHVWDSEVPEEQGYTLPPAAAQRVAQRVEAAKAAPPADAPPLPDLFSDLDRRLERLAYRRVQGQDWSAGGTALSAEPVIGGLEVREEIARRLGRGLSLEEGDWWRAQAGEGVPGSRLEALWMQFCSDQQHDLERSSVR